MMSIQELAAKAQEYKNQYMLQVISAQEFKELVDDLNIMQEINQQSEELNTNETYYNVLMGIVQLAGAI
jgi:hypothetical protein